MIPALRIDADLSVTSGDGTQGTLRGSGSDLTFTLEVLGARREMRRHVARLADGLRQVGIHVAVVDSRGRELARLGRGVDSRLGWLLLGSRGIHLRRRLLSVARSR